MVRACSVAAGVNEAERLGRWGEAFCWRRNIVEFRRLVVTSWKVEADRPPAPPAKDSIAFAKLGNAVQLLLLALELPRVQISAKTRVTLHGNIHKSEDLAVTFRKSSCQQEISVPMRM